jgi:hypothetical protein
MEVAMKLLLVLIAFLFASPPALADHTSFVVTNRSPVTILSVYATSVVNRQYGYDLLGNGVIEPGQRRRVVPYDNRGCLFDVKFTFLGGHEVTRRGLNLCTITVLSTTGEGVGIPRRNERPDAH